MASAESLPSAKLKITGPLSTSAESSAVAA